MGHCGVVLLRLQPKHEDKRRDRQRLLHRKLHQARPIRHAEGSLKGCKPSGRRDRENLGICRIWQHPRPQAHSGRGLSDRGQDCPPQERTGEEDAVLEAIQETEQAAMTNASVARISPGHTALILRRGSLPEDMNGIPASLLLTGSK